MADEEFVTVGSALPQCEDEEIQSRKPVTVHDQVVRDDQGRIRFHGAFTGGFSAGYFNSVDTKEGWVPKTFKSSRSSRNQGASNQKPEDFMDKEDFGEFGIAPKKLFTSNKYQGSSKHSWKAPHENSLFSLFSNPELQHCVEPAKLTIGQNLLRKLGWRSSSANVHEETNDDEFGCALPPSLVAKITSKRSTTSHQSESVCAINFSTQNNQFGLGYKGLKPEILKPVSSAPSQNKGRGIKGLGFGVGALEEEDDDIYAGDSVLNYDTILCMDDEELTQSPIKKSHNARKGKYIDGFTKSSGIPMRIEVYKPPLIPDQYNLTPVSQNKNLTSNLEDHLGKVRYGNYRPMSSFKRGELLGEKLNIGSVFELISEKDKLKLDEAKRSLGILKSGSSEEQSDRHAGTEDDKNIKQSGNHSTLPLHHTCPNSDKDIENHENVTEWEKEQKRENLVKTTHFSQTVMKGRFTKASQDDENGSLPEKKEQSSKEKAASEKMFGNLTRETVTWHPSKLLCVRFNVQDPYPESTIVGLPTQKHSKLSIFDVLTRSDLFTKESQHPSIEQDSNKTKSQEKPTASKPLAILATIDLRPIDDDSSSVSLIPADSHDIPKDDKHEPRESSVEDKSDKINQTPSVDIFKAIFEDDDSEQDDEVKVDTQQPIKNETSLEGYRQETEQNMQMDVSWNAQPISEVTSNKRKHKKEKHKKHSHKTKKTKKSKKEKRDKSDDNSEDSYSELSKEEKHILSKLRRSIA